MGIEIDYDLVATGWSTCVVRTDQGHADITASYLSNALGDLAAAAVMLLEGATEARFSFDEEPGEYRWLLEVTSSGLRVRILEFEELWGDQPDDAGRVRLDALCSVDEFAGAVQRALKAVDAKYGVEGYRKKWVEHDFPKAELDTLEAKLNARTA